MLTLHQAPRWSAPVASGPALAGGPPQPTPVQGSKHSRSPYVLTCRLVLELSAYKTPIPNPPVPSGIASDSGLWCIGVFIFALEKETSNSGVGKQPPPRLSYITFVVPFFGQEASTSLYPHSLLSEAPETFHPLVHRVSSDLS